MLPLSQKTTQFRISLRQRGWATTLYWSAFGVLRPNRFAILAIDLTAMPEPESSTEEVEFAMWDAARVARWREQRSDLPTDMFRDVIDGAKRCAVAVSGESIVAMIWVFRVGDTSRLFELEDGEAELNHGFTAPEFRGRGIFSSLLRHACGALRAEGCGRAYAGVHAGNAPSLRSFENAGFREIASIRHWLAFRPKVHRAKLAAAKQVVGRWVNS